MNYENGGVFRVGDLFDLINGYAFKGTDFIEFGVPVIKIKNVKPSKIVLNDLSFVSREIADSTQRFRIVPNDILITMSGNRIDGTPETWVGKVAIFKEKGEYLLNQRVGILRPKNGVKVDLDYLAYLLSSYYYQECFITSANSSGGQANISPSIIYDIEVVLPSYHTQRRIAAILTALDDKIELNRQMNETLEGIAQAVWGEWFGKYANGEEELPKGWRWGLIGDVCSANKSTLSKNDPIEWVDYIEISEVNRGKIGNVTRYERGTEPSRARRRIQHGDIVLSTVRPNRGAYFLAQLPEETTIVSTGFAVFTAEKVPFGFLYICLTQDEMLDFYGQMADGAAYPSINPSVILEKEIVIPDEDLLDIFQLVVEPIFENIFQNNNQSRTLATLRDVLLPRLMRGEVEV